MLLNSVEVRAPRRVRLTFDRQLAAGAYTSTTYYVITNTDSSGVKPNVVGTLQVSGMVASIELVLDADLVDGGLYSADLTAVPAQDATTFTGSQPFRLGIPQGNRPNVDAFVSDADAWLFGVDVLWSGADFVETPQGDLEVVSGLENVMLALQRRVRALGLPWNPKYGARLDEFVGSPPTVQITARGAITAQLLADDRVESVEIRVLYDDANNPSEVQFDIQPVLKGGRRPPNFTESSAL